MAQAAPLWVKEIFGPTIQGEGAHAGAACVFLRFAGCNLACSWCDTDFSAEGARRMDAQEIVAQLLQQDEQRARMVVVTGGEPTLQWHADLSLAVSAAGFRIHMESNGTQALAAPVDWLTISPKPRFHESGESLLVTSADECKLVVDDSVDDEALERYEAMNFDALFLQPCWVGGHETWLAKSLDLVRRHPQWRLSLQLHKLVGLP